VFDINTIVNAAISSAVEQATKPLLDRLQGLQDSLERQRALTVEMRNRITLLENAPKGEIAPTQSVLESLDNQEWFWEKIRNFVDSGVESAIDSHCEHYDHEEYDRVVSEVGDVDLSDLVSRDMVEDTVRDVINNASFSVSV